MNVTIRAYNFDLTPEYETLVHDKLVDGLRMLGRMNREAAKLDVDLERAAPSRHGDELYRIAANLTLPRRFIRIEESGASIPDATMKVRRGLMRHVRKWRHRMMVSRRRHAGEHDAPASL